MSIIKKILLKIRIEAQFLVEQKWGLRKPADPYTIPKYLLRKYLPANPVIIDCGAHIGADSVELAKIFPEATIHSFEPVPALFIQLKHTIRNFSNIHCYQLALSVSNTVSSMFISSGSSDASSSLLMPSQHTYDHPEVLFREEINVNTMTLDSWAEAEGIKQIDFLWLDMQGLEYEVLKNSPYILRSVQAIHTEVSMREAYAGSILYPEFRDWLNGQGYKEVIKAVPPGADMGNVLFVRDN